MILQTPFQGHNGKKGGSEKWEAILLKSNGLHIRPVWANATLTLSLAKI